MWPLKDDFQPGDRLQDVPADWLNTLARWFNTFGVVGGGYVRKSDGAHCKVVISVGMEIAQPFDIVDFDKDDGTLTVRQGYLEVHSDDGTELVSVDTTATLTAGANYVFVQADFAAGLPSSVSLVVGGAIDTYASDATNYVKLIWAIDVTETDEILSITSATKYCPGNPEFVGWRP